jgi:hypothetical protein
VEHNGNELRKRHKYSCGWKGWKEIHFTHLKERQSIFSHKHISLSA